MSKLEKLQRQYEEAAERLAAEVVKQCPGVHQVVQHRDMNPPWCPACRRTIEGKTLPAPSLPRDPNLPRLVPKQASERCWSCGSRLNSRVSCRACGALGPEGGTA